LASAAPAGLFDFEQPVFVERNHLIKDHSLIHDGDRFHLFYTRSHLDVTGGREPSFGHATSLDLRHWEHLPQVLALQEEGFAERALWAPQVLALDSLPGLGEALPAAARWVMLFTGVRESQSQAIGLAWSPDLYDWEMLPEPVFTPGAWSDWIPDGWADCRDPFLFAEGDSLYLLASASTAAGFGALAVGVSGGGLPFADRGAPLLVSPDDGAVESAFMVNESGGSLLFYTRGGVGGSSVLAAPGPFGPWDLAQGIKFDEGAAPEVNGFDGSVLAPAGWEGAETGGWVFSRHENYDTGERLFYAIQFDTINLLAESWPPPMTDRQGFGAGLPGWSSTPVSGLTGPDAYLPSPTFEDNPAYRGAVSASGFEGHSWISTFESYRSVAGGVASHVGEILGAAAQGRLRSPAFIVEGDRLDFLLAGGAKPDSCWVALRRASDDALLFRTVAPGGAGTGVAGTEGLPLSPRAWDLRGLRGVSVYLEIVDGAQGLGGFIACDAFAHGDGDPAMGEPSMVATPALGFVVRNPYPSPWRQSAGSLALPIRVDVPGYFRADLYDVAGREVGRLSDGFLDAGEWTPLWSVEERLGSGVYLIRWRGGRGERVRKVIVMP
jgi:hypothetical protein